MASAVSKGQKMSGGMNWYIARRVPSGVWNKPALPSNSLVGRPAPEIAPGRGEAGERPWLMPEGGRAAPGPMEARKLGDLPLALPAGPGEGLGLGGA